MLHVLLKTVIRKSMTFYMRWQQLIGLEFEGEDEFCEDKKQGRATKQKQCHVAVFLIIRHCVHFVVCLLFDIMVVLSSFQAMKYPSVRQRHGNKLMMGIRCGVPVEKTQYKDGVLERAFMGLFAKKMEKFGKRRDDDDDNDDEKKKKKKKKQKWIFDYDYESFVEVSRGVMMGRSPAQQQQLVRQVLLSMLPPQAPAQFRKLFPPTKWAAEFNAALTVPFFHWLVGPSQVMEVEINGVRQKSGVLIKKCRYLESSGCVGMCVNMCKIPTQDFFTNEFGLPLTMTPNFEDMSCEMVYGRIPPKFEDDPASKHPCLPHFCSVAQPNSTICPKLQA